MLKQIKYRLKNEEGSGLILTLMVLLVLSVLGASLGTLTIGSLNLSDKNRENNSAYYIAEAGANMAYEEFKKDVEKSYNEDTVTSDTSFFSSVKGKVQSSESPYRTYGKGDYKEQFGDSPTAIVSIDPPPSSAGIEREYTINSVGEVNGQERTVAKKVLVTWKDKSTVGSTFPTMPAGAALIVKEGISLKDKTIKGDIYLDSSGEKKFTIGKGTENQINQIGKIYANYTGETEGEKESIFSFPDYYHSKGNENLSKKFTNKVEKINKKIDWDSITVYRNSMKEIGDATKISMKKSIEELREATVKINKTGLNFDINDKHKQPIPLKENYRQPKILFQGNHTIDIGDKNILLATTEIQKKWGETKVVGEGSITFFVSEKADLTGGPFNTDENRVDLIIYLDRLVSSTKVAGASTYYAQIIAPYSDIEVSGSGAVIGDITAQNVVVSGAGKVTGNITADQVTIQSGKKIIGDIVANRVVLSGSGEVLGNIISDSIIVPEGAKVTGNLVAKNVNFSGGGKVIGNVSADEVNISGGGLQVLGSIIAHDVSISGGGTIEYHYFNFNDYDSESNESDVRIDDLINPRPAIEVEE